MVSIANYDWIYWAIFGLLSVSFVFFPLYPTRKGIGKRGYDHNKYSEETEEYEESMNKRYKEARDKIKALGLNPYFRVLPDDPNHHYYWCQRVRACDPFNHLAWFRWVYTLALGVCFSIHIKFYFVEIDPGEIGHQVDNQMWSSLGFGVAGAWLMIVLFPILQDAGFAIGAWLTTIIWILRTWGSDLQLGVTITVVSMTVIVALFALGFCLFWAFCATASCLLCCCSDSIGHWLAIFMTRLHMDAVVAFAMTWCFYVPGYSVGYYDNGDYEWMTRCMWTAALILAVRFSIRVICCRRDSTCFKAWADPDVHVVARAIMGNGDMDERGQYRTTASGPPVALTGIHTDDIFDVEDGNDGDDIGHAYSTHTELSLDESDEEEADNNVVPKMLATPTSESAVEIDSDE